MKSNMFWWAPYCSEINERGPLAAAGRVLSGPSIGRPRPAENLPKRFKGASSHPSGPCCCCCSFSTTTTTQLSSVWARSMIWIIHNNKRGPKRMKDPPFFLFLNSARCALRWPICVAQGDEYVTASSTPSAGSSGMRSVSNRKSRPFFSLAHRLNAMTWEK